MADGEDAQGASRLLQAVEAIAIKPEDATSMVTQYVEVARKAKPKASQSEIENAVAKKIISRYARLASMSGGMTSLSGVLPGIGTAVAMIGGGLTDAAICMKLQVDMTMCLAATFGWDLSGASAK